MLLGFPFVSRMCKVAFSPHLQIDGISNKLEAKAIAFCVPVNKFPLMSVFSPYILTGILSSSAISVKPSIASKLKNWISSQNTAS